MKDVKNIYYSTILRKFCALLLVFLLFLTLVGCDNKDDRYNEAIKMYEDGNFKEANEIFQELSSFKDSYNYIQECSYNLGKQELKEGNYEEAYSLFEKIIEFKDVREILSKSRFERAIAYLKQENYDKAVELLEAIGDYGEYPTYLAQVYYNYGVKNYNISKFSEAAKCFSKSNYSNASELKYLSKYFDAVSKVNSGNYIGAYDIFKDISDDTHENRIKAANHTNDLRKKLIDFSWQMTYSSDRKITFTFDGNKVYFIIFDTSFGGATPKSTLELYVVHAYDGMIIMDKTGKTYKLGITIYSENSIDLRFSDSSLLEANGTYTKVDMPSNETVYHRIAESAGTLSPCNYTFPYDGKLPEADKPNLGGSSNSNNYQSNNQSDKEDSTYNEPYYENYEEEDSGEGDLYEDDSYEVEESYEEDYQEEYVFEAE